MESFVRTTFRPEERALVCCARVALDAAARQELATLAEGGLDYARLANLGDQHGLTPLLCRHLSQALPTHCPPPVLAALRAQTQEHVLKSLAAASELVTLLKGFASAGVGALALKGPVSALLGYGDLGLRTFSDLDILVNVADVERATALLEARDYVPQLGLSSSDRARLLRSNNPELLFVHADECRLVDLHWELLPRGYSFTPGHDGLFARRQSVRVGTAHVPTLANEATLIFLLLHGMKHDWSSLGWLCDVAELLRRQTLDWDAVLCWSHARGPRRLVDVGLALVHTLLRAPVPDFVLQRGRTDGVNLDTVHALTTQLWKSTPEHTIRPRGTRRAYFRNMERTRDKLRFIHDFVLRPTAFEWQAVRLPRRLTPLYYLIRPVRLLWKHGLVKARHALSRLH